MTKIEIEALDYLQQPQLHLQLNQQLLDGVTSIVNLQKEEMVRSGNEKLQKFEAGIKESHQDLAESVIVGKLFTFTTLKRKDKLQNSFCLKFFKTKQIEQAWEELQGIHSTHCQTSETHKTY